MKPKLQLRVFHSPESLRFLLVPNKTALGLETQWKWTQIKFQSFDVGLGGEKLEGRVRVRTITKQMKRLPSGRGSGLKPLLTQPQHEVSRAVSTRAQSHLLSHTLKPSHPSREAAGGAALHCPEGREKAALRNPSSATAHHRLQRSPRGTQTLSRPAGFPRSARFKKVDF